MAKYQSVLNSTWDDPVFQQWGCDAKLIFLNLITSQRHNPVGIYAVTTRTLMLETGLPEDRFLAAFAEIQTPYTGYARVQYDASRAVVWIVNSLKHQTGVNAGNKNLLRCIQAILRQYAASPLIGEFLALYTQRGFRGILKAVARGVHGSVQGGRGPLEGTSKGPPKSTSPEKSPDLSFVGKGFPGKGATPAVPRLEAALQALEAVFGDAAFRAQLGRAYPQVDLVREAEKMRAWLKANPSRVKKQWRRFVHNWINHAAQDREAPRASRVAPDPRSERGAQLDAITEHVEMP